MEYLTKPAMSPVMRATLAKVQYPSTRNAGRPAATRGKFWPSTRFVDFRMSRLFVPVSELPCSPYNYRFAFRCPSRKDAHALSQKS